MLKALFVGWIVVAGMACGAEGPEDVDRVLEHTSSALTGERGWQSVMIDDFDGTTLNRNIWETKFRWNARSLPVNGHQQCFLDENVSVGNGVVTLEARVQTSTCEGRTVPFSSGLLSAHPSMSQRYGYFETRAKLARGQGFWSAFWLLPHPTPGAPYQEIDVVELLGSTPERAYMNVHWQHSGVRQDASTAYDNCMGCGPDFTAAFHTFAVLWESTSVKWYVDGIERKSFAPANSAHVPDQPAYVIADLAVGGHWPGPPNATTPFPSSMQIDSIKALRRVNASGPAANRVRNPGFESGIANWELHGGATVTNSTRRTGSRSVRIAGHGGARQVISALQPFTAYRLSGFIRSTTGATTMIGVKDYGGGHQLQNYVKSAEWTPVSVVFSTGNATSATIFAFQSDPSAIAFYDDLSLTVL